MTGLSSGHWSRRTVQVDGTALTVWPEHQKISKLRDSLVLMTRFTDVARYHPALIRKILQLESSSRFRGDYALGGCGIKVYHLDRWQCPEAELIHQRALAFFSEVFKCDTPVADVSMANIFHKGDYCMPHSHTRTRASLVYSVSCGDPDPHHERSGKLCFVDPRMKACCQDQPERMTTPLVPDMEPGTLLMFPSEVMHCVTPYTGKSPRITLAWNIDSHALSGAAIPGGLPER